MNKRAKHTVLATLAIIILTVVATACSAAATELPAFEEAAAPAAMEMPAAEVQTVLVEKEVEARDNAAGQAQAPPSTTAGGGGLNDILPSQVSRMVIKDAFIDLLVENSQRAADQVTDMAAVMGGYIISSRVWYEDEQLYATIRMAVPSENFERTLTQLRGLAVQVINETASGQDVSAEYNDLQSRLNNLEATAARVRTFLDEAKTVEESLKINATLSDLER